MIWREVMHQKKLKKRIYWKEFLSNISLYVFVGFVCFILFNKIFSLNIVQQQSMMPNIHGFIVSNRLAYEKRNPNRGDVIIFHEGEKILVKRIIGLPGEELRIYGGKVFIDGKLLKEPYLKEDVITDGNKTYKIPDGMYFVMGDNRENSIDSRTLIYTYIDRNEIIGRTFLDFYTPLNVKYLDQYF